jgi:phage terminase small subunit
MPNHRKPTELLELSDAFKNHPKRKRPIGPKSPAGIGEPPARLTAEEREVWQEIKFKAPQGVLTAPDGFMMETLCQLIAAMRARVITDAQRNQMIRLLSLIGFTPADRSRITAVGKTDEADPFSKFVN